MNLGCRTVSRVRLKYLPNHLNRGTGIQIRARLPPFPPQAPIPAMAGIHRSGLVDQGRDLLVPLYGQLEQHPQGATREQHCREVVDGHGDEQRPGGPLGQQREPEGGEHGDGDERGLVERDGDGGRGQRGERERPRGVGQEEREGDGVEREAEAGEEEERDLAAEDEEDGERGEAEVGAEAGRAAEVEEEREQEGGGRDGDDEGEGGDERRGYVVPSGDAAGGGRDGGGEGRRGGGRGEEGDQEHDEEHAGGDGVDDAGDVLAERVQHGGAGGAINGDGGSVGVGHLVDVEWGSLPIRCWDLGRLVLRPHPIS